MTEIKFMRETVSNLYESPRWKRRVKNMSDSQVIAIYMEKQMAPKVQEVKRDLDNKDTLF